MNGKKALLSAIALTGAVVAAPAFAGLDADRPGGVLVYPVFESGNGVTTQLRLTYLGYDPQTDIGYGAKQKFKFVTVCGYDKREYPFAQQLLCQSTDKVVELTAKETYVIDVEELNPQCTEGFVVAYPVEYNQGENEYFATGRNVMIGSYLIEKASPKRGMADQAISIQYVGSPDQVFEEDLDFNGSDWEDLPETLWTDFRAVSFEPTKATDLVLLSMDTLAGRNNYPTFVSIDAWNEHEEAYSAANEFFCWNRFRLDDVNRGFRMNNTGGQNGDEYGALRVASEETNSPDGPSEQTILGAILERSEYYWSARNMYFEPEFESTTFTEN